jgi:hypothetical protein
MLQLQTKTQQKEAIVKAIVPIYNVYFNTGKQILLNCKEQHTYTADYQLIFSTKKNHVADFFCKYFKIQFLEDKMVPGGTSLNYVKLVYNKFIGNN